MKEYFKEPEMTASTLIDGFLHTGDRGTVDSDGFLKITGRVKEIFKTDKGKYVAPAPIEMKLSRNQLIEQICVVGATLPQPIALVVLSADAKTKPTQEVKQQLAETLTTTNAELEKHERIQKLVIMKDDWTLENGLLTPTLKIKRNPIEDKYQSNYQSWYDHKDAVVAEMD